MSDYKIWEHCDSYGEFLYNRSIGEIEEMEASKVLCDILKPIYKPGMKVLDVGCATGHYLRSFRNRLDKDIYYTGVDNTPSYISKAEKAFSGARFFVEDIHSINFRDNSFDIVVCNNLIMHLPPPPIKAITELIRVSSKYTVIRTPVGKRNYIIREVKDHYDDLDIEDKKNLTTLINEDGEPQYWNYLNLYTKEFIEDIILKVNPDYNITFIDDNPKELGTKIKSKTATEVVDGKQVCGNIVLDWKFIVVEKC